MKNRKVGRLNFRMDGVEHVICTGESDTSISTPHSSYSLDCDMCRLGYSHTLDYHEKEVVK